MVYEEPSDDDYPHQIARLTVVALRKGQKYLSYYYYNMMVKDPEVPEGEKKKVKDEYGKTWRDIPKARAIISSVRSNLVMVRDKNHSWYIGPKSNKSTQFRIEELRRDGVIE